MVLRLFYLVSLLGFSARADDLQYLDHSELALARLYDDISNAESTIDLSYLIWDPCSTAAKVITKKLQEKAHPTKKGVKPVKVRVMLDSFFDAKNHAAMQDYLAKSGIEVKFYNGANIASNFHNHSKLTLIDKKVKGKAVLVTGGRNIADDYFGMAKHNFVDRDVAVKAPSSTEDKNGTIAQAEGGFDRLWANPKSLPVGPPNMFQKARFAGCSRWGPKEAALEKYLQKNAKKIIASEKPVSCQNVKFAMDDMSHVGLPTGQMANAKPSSREVIHFMQGAQRSLTMENQYFIPDNQYMSRIISEKKRKPGFKIDLYSNMFDKDYGIESVIDIKDFEMVSLQQKESMRAFNGGGETNHMNFRIAGAMDRWDFSPRDTSYTYHAKTFVADSKDAIVSSFNIDPRSMNLNGESTLVVKNCPVFAKKVEDMAKITGKVWTLEENLQVCLTGFRPRPPLHGPLTHLLEFFTRDLQ